jgi:hypothetical protein
MKKLLLVAALMIVACAGFKPHQSLRTHAIGKNPCDTFTHREAILIPEGDGIQTAIFRPHVASDWMIIDRIDSIVCDSGVDK